MMLRARHVWSLVLLACFVAAAGRSSAQAPAQPSFDVASIKPNTSGTNQRQFNIGLKGRFTATNVPLFDLVRFAYAEGGPDGILGPLPPNRLMAAATWAGGARILQSDKFDVVATTDPSASQEQVLVMLRSLLTERFALRVHRETRDLPIYALILARSDGSLGPRLRPSKIDCGAMAPDSTATVPVTDGFVATPCRGLRNVPGKATGRAVTIPTLAALMSGWVDDHRPVEDRTGLTGNFDIDLDWTPDQPRSVPPPGAPSLPPTDADGAGLFTAMQEQLGLKVQSTKKSIDILVVDYATRPTEN